MRYIVYVVMMIGLLGCESNKNYVPTNEPPADKVQTEFNTSDKSMMTNGNLLVASARLEKGLPTDTITKINAENLSKSPYSSIGKLHKIYGKIYKIEELPPALGLKGQWTEILLITGNPNSPLGSSTIDCIFQGSAENFKSGKVASCSGYFIGTFESTNAMGGSVESYVFMGQAKMGRE